MRIAHIAPLYEPVPPPRYGGTERVIGALASGLLHRGHGVTVFGSGDSTTEAALVSCCPRALHSEPAPWEYSVYTAIQLGEVARRAGEFDVIHNHIGYLAFPLSRCLRPPVLTTVHVPLDRPDLQTVYRRFPDVRLISISEAQRRLLPSVRWMDTVYNGIDVERYALGAGRGGYLVFLGRFCPHKGAHRAIEVARAAGMPLRIAARPPEPEEIEYFDAMIRPMLAPPHVEYVGEVDDAQKNVLLGGAAACLYPVDWPESFGLAMVEAMACGTPVIALDHGAVPEVVSHGRTGFVCRSLAEMVRAVPLSMALDRRGCRADVVRRFSVERMVDRYEAHYQMLAGRRPVSLGLDRRAGLAAAPAGD